MAVGVWLPFSPLAKSLGFTPLPWLYWPLLAATLLCYIAADATGQDVAAAQALDLRNGR